MKQFEIEAIRELKDFYFSYIEGNYDLDRAKHLHEEYTPAGLTLLSKEVVHAVSKLLAIYVNTGAKQPSREEAKKIIGKLKAREAELSEGSE